jgi:hypothetical protein
MIAPIEAFFSLLSAFVSVVSIANGSKYLLPIHLLSIKKLAKLALSASNE